MTTHPTPPAPLPGVPPPTSGAAQEEELARLRAEVAELREALGNYLSIHDRAERKYAEDSGAPYKPCPCFYCAEFGAALARTGSGARTDAEGQGNEAAPVPERCPQQFRGVQCEKAARHRGRCYFGQDRL
jgi:hypothetical protein